MSRDKFVNIAKLVSMYDLNIDNGGLPDNLKCVHCKSVLKNACQVPCGCRLCRCCIDDLRANGATFCLGVAEDCGKSLLSDFSTDYIANNSISRLPVKCPKNGCLIECSLANMEEHLRVCKIKCKEYLFQDSDCQHGKLSAEDVSGHFQPEILIGMISNINNEIAALKRNEESNKKEIEMLKCSDEWNKNKIGILENELVLKDGQINMVINEMGSIKNEIMLIQEVNDDIIEQMRFVPKQSTEINERREINGIDIGEIIEHLEKVITATKEALRGKDQQDKSTKSNIHIIKSPVQSIQRPEAIAGQADASCEWLIDKDVRKSSWRWGDKSSHCFHGSVYPYKYQLGSVNGGRIGDVLWIYLFLHHGMRDAHLPWPFRGQVTVIVDDKDKPHLCHTITRQCMISRPPENDIYIWSDPYRFLHSDLIKAGINLGGAIRVSCFIVPSADR